MVRFTLALIALLFDGLAAELDLDRAGARSDLGLRAVARRGA